MKKIKITIIIIVAIVGAYFVYMEFVKRTTGARLITPEDREYARRGALDLYQWRLKSYKKRNGRYPNDLEELGKLGVSTRNNGPIEYTIGENGQTYELRDLGKDEIAGTDDDIFLTSESEK